MSENLQNLSQKLANALEFSDIEIPSYITQNLNKDLREYQIKALKHYLTQRKKPQTNHLMFNMATGSGKTLIMAALMLECYARGYRDFVFFVNSNAVLEKTKANFCDEKSAKYLFKPEIIINNERVKINPISTLDESSEGAINVYFSTVQGLYSLFTNERENAMTLADLAGKRLVFLADEAHHLNANTKAQESDDKKTGWEGVIKQAFESCAENLLFEFSATIPNEKAVKEKYKDKIVFEYALKEFCAAGYSKRINVAKYDNTELKSRILGAVFLSLYRQFVAAKNGLFLKPVILFKSESIKESKDNEKFFKELVENLGANDVRAFYSALSGDGENHLVKSRAFFEREFNGDLSPLVNLVKNNFSEQRIINVNDDKEAVNHQILLNSLEDKDNEIRIIFAVDKLNEGWDVLNLFDIVRLGSKKSSAATTTKEAQLIGRGARYYPFMLGENSEKFKRKFDSEGENEASVLERLSYHTINDVEFIEMLNSKMSEAGLFGDFEDESVLLTPTQRASEVTNGRYELHFVGNAKYKFDKASFMRQSGEQISQLAQGLEVPLFANGVRQYTLFEDELKKPERAPKFERGRLSRVAFFKAMNACGVEFGEVQKNFSVASRNEFFELISNSNLNFDKRQDFNAQNQLQISKFILENLKKSLVKRVEFEVSGFGAKSVKMGKRVILRKKGAAQESEYEWLYYDKWTRDSDLEREFVGFIEGQKEQINAAFERWIVVRNEGFAEFKLFNNARGEGYGDGFEPDFIFFGARAGAKFLSVQAVFEVKGAIYEAKDAWKATLLKAISGEYFGLAGESMQVRGFGFFVRELGGSAFGNSKGGLRREFIEEFEEFLGQ